jgi:hypothetical protein
VPVAFSYFWIRTTHGLFHFDSWYKEGKFKIISVHKVETTDGNADVASLLEAALALNEEGS